MRRSSCSVGLKEGRFYSSMYNFISEESYFGSFIMFDWPWASIKRHISWLPCLDVLCFMNRRAVLVVSPVRWSVWVWEFSLSRSHTFWCFYPTPGDSLWDGQWPRRDWAHCSWRLVKGSRVTCLVWPVSCDLCVTLAFCPLTVSSPFWSL